ncbi:MAG: shikimate dehydrogenase [Acidimicrobiia bacterium]
MIGDPVAHSLSPVLHNAGFQAADLDWVYVALPVPAGRAPEALAAMRLFGLGGLSVTMPHKEAVAAALDGRLSASAQLLGAVNCVRWDGDDLVGENTDGGGFVDSLRLEAGTDPGGAHVVLLGAGGAGRAVAVALAEAGVDRLTIINRDPAKAARTAALIGDVATVGEMDAVRSADIVVNATSVGMGLPASDGVLPCPAGLLHGDQVVADLVYQPLETGLLRAAAERGARTVNGVGMLLYQAVRAFEHWTNTSAPVAAMRGAVDALIA